MQFFYKAPLLVLLPGGSLRPMHSYEFQLSRMPRWYARRFNVASDEPSAAVDAHTTNGWGIVAINHRHDDDRAALDTTLTRQQREALFDLAERSWLSGWCERA
ncbi:hypothetical protein [Corynebacterium timonense]|uniref:hypothetical protein n=1 Tax=Corynebacterium timonense TaxID=441500 RepID=UPI0002F155EE|nr:hypothetical protein [Corynebacterium timonense]